MSVKLRETRVFLTLLHWRRFFLRSCRADGVSEDVAQPVRRRRRRRKLSCGEVFMFRGGGEDLLQECWGGAAAQTGFYTALVG